MKPKSLILLTALILTALLCAAPVAADAVTHNGKTIHDIRPNLCLNHIKLLWEARFSPGNGRMDGRVGLHGMEKQRRPRSLSGRSQRRQPTAQAQGDYGWERSSWRRPWRWRHEHRAWVQLSGAAGIWCGLWGLSGGCLRNYDYALNGTQEPAETPYIITLHHIINWDDLTAHHQYMQLTHIIFKHHI